MIVRLSRDGKTAMSGTGVRNFITPHVKGDPDHYLIRLITSLDNDNAGGVSSLS